jgi:hypothetical protein
MTPTAGAAPSFPIPLDAYPPPSAHGLLATLADRAALDPFNLLATGIFVCAILHTLGAARIARLAHRVQHAADERAHRERRPPAPSVLAEFLHFFGEVEVVFGLWAVLLIAAITAIKGWEVATHYLDEGVVFTEAMFVVVIMALASTRPVIGLAERSLQGIAGLGGRTPAAWWLTILTVGPLLGSFITEPAAMTISALLLARQFYDRQPSNRLKYATLGLLFVNVSVGGTLTHFAAPPVLMVARTWGWDTPFMLSHFGWRAVASVLASNTLYFLVFRRELAALANRGDTVEIEQPDEAIEASGGSLLPVPAWITIVHLGFIAWTVFTSHHPTMFLPGFLFFLGFARATASYQSRLELRGPLLVGFFLGGLVIHGTLQAWWIAPVLASLSEEPLFVGATILTAFNDNALITYLATLVPSLGPSLQAAVVEGAVTGGGLTVIANAPNPAGQALLSRFFGGAIVPLWLFVSAVPPTIVAAVMFRLI